MWFDIVKNRTTGNRPHFYQWLSRAFKSSSEHTPQYLKRNLGWNELDSNAKLIIKNVFDQLESDRKSGTPPKGSWGRKKQGIDGIRVDFTDIHNPKMDRQFYDDWRHEQRGTGNKPDTILIPAGSRWSMSDDSWEQDKVYRIMRQLLRRNNWS